MSNSILFIPMFAPSTLPTLLRSTFIRNQSSCSPRPCRTIRIRMSTQPNGPSQNQKDASSTPSEKPTQFFPPSNTNPPSDPPPPSRPWWIRIIKDDDFDDLRTFTIAFACALILRTVIVEPRYIPSLSMFPTFDVGDQFLVDKISRRLREPNRNEVVVFEPPPALRERGYRKSDAFIKRIIARQGDTVYIHDGIVEINGVAKNEPFINEKPNYKWGPGTVPPGYVMVLGDNRNNSYDSHIWGYLPEENIIGRALVRYWPPSRIGTTFF